MSSAVLSNFMFIIFSLLCSTVFSQSDCVLQNSSDSGMTCGVRNCCEFRTNEAVTCESTRRPRESCACRKIRRYLNMMRNITIDDIQMQCSPQLCTVSCDEGFIGDNVTYVCNDNPDCCTPTSVEIKCERVKCPQLTNGMISCLNDSTTGMFEDTCTFTCNDGYLLQGSEVEECLADGSWSGGNPVCIAGEQSRDVGRIITGAVFGTILAVLIIIIIVLCCVIWRRRYRRKQKIYHVYAKVNEGAVSRIPDVIYDTVRAPYVQYEQAYCETFFNKDRRYSFINEAVSRMEPTCELDATIKCDYATVEEEEQKIYDMVEEDQDCGPIYTDPPTEEEEIYEIFRGKNINTVQHNSIRMLEHLGSGEFGVVAHGLLDDSLEVAVKTLNDNASDKDRLRFLQEAAIMCQFDHQNVIKLHGIVTEAPITIVLEYMPHGDLRQVLIELRSLSDEAVVEKLPFFLLKFCQEVAAGIAYLNGKQFIHRDLAARNILVSESYTCKIADFGMSRDVVNSIYYIASGGKIPVKWTAPEALFYKKYSLFSDMWSYGCVLFEIWSLGCKPFEHVDNIEVLKMINKGYRLPPPPGCSRMIYRMMIKCWNPDPRARPQFGQINKILAKDARYLLAWSDEDKQSAGEDGMKLGASLQFTHNLYPDLQFTYKQN